MGAFKGNGFENVEDEVYRYLADQGYNLAVICGILANIQGESSFDPNAVGDDGDAYGLFQWNDRRENLYNFTGVHKYDHIPVPLQLSYFTYELYGEGTRSNPKGSEKKTAIYLNTVTNLEENAAEVARKFCELFERPADPIGDGNDRAEWAVDIYWKHYSNQDTEDNSSVGKFVKNRGKDIVDIALAQVGKAYKSGSVGPPLDMPYTTKSGEFDEIGLIYYCYAKADLGRLGIRADMDIPLCLAHCKKYGRNIPGKSREDIRQGDLIFMPTSFPFILDNIAIALGDKDDSIVYAERGKEVIKDRIPASSFFNCEIYRLLSDAETSREKSSEDNDSDDILDPKKYAELTSIDPYAALSSINLSRFEAEGYDYGYLLDLTHGGEFRFHIPEFQESAGATWSDIDIRGRSVNIKSYDNTNSRTASISLDLYAGEGVYRAIEGESGASTVDRLHRDANFLKSLEYPDYTYVITNPPPTVQLILGSSFNMIGIVSEVTIDHCKPFDSENRAMYIRVSFTVTQTAVNPIDWRDVRASKHTITSSSDKDSMNEGIIDVGKSVFGKVMDSAASIANIP